MQLTAPMGSNAELREWLLCLRDNGCPTVAEALQKNGNVVTMPIRLIDPTKRNVFEAGNEIQARQAVQLTEEDDLAL